MKTSNHHNLKLLSLIIPCLFLFLIFGTPLLRGEVFHRIAVYDAQWFYKRYVDNGENFGLYNNSRCTTNVNFVPSSGDTFYTDYLDTMGITHCFTPIIHCTTGHAHSFLEAGEHIYDDILVKNGNNGRVLWYGFGHDFECGVGDEDFPPDYFTSVHDSLAGRIDDDLAVGSEPSVIISERDSSDAGFIIDHTFGWKDFNSRTGRRHFYVRMCMRIDTTDCGSSDPLVFRVIRSAGSSDMEIEDSCYYSPYGYPWYNGIPPQDDENLPDTFDIHASLFDTVGLEYDTIDFEKEFIPPGNGLRFEVYWADSVDVYLDWIRFFDQEFHDMAIAADSIIFDFSN